MVIVEHDAGFKLSDLSAPARARDVARGKKIIVHPWSNSAPTSLNLPHNSFLRPSKKAVDESKRSDLLQLRKASKYGDNDLLRRLVENGAHVNSKLDVYESTALHYAACHGKTNTVRLLISFGADANAVNRDLKTALHMAASNGYASTARCLVQAGANLMMKNSEGQTPLDCAEQWGNTETSAALKQVIADLESKPRKPHDHSWRVQSANRLDYPRRVASYVMENRAIQLCIRPGYQQPGGGHHVSVQRVGVWPCTEAWR